MLKTDKVESLQDVAQKLDEVIVELNKTQTYDLAKKATGILDEVYNMIYFSQTPPAP